MKILPVHNIQSKPPVLRGISFTAATAPVKSDVFVKSALSEFEQLKSVVYETISSKISKIKPEEIEDFIKTLSAKTETGEKQILNIMARITAYSGYKSLATIQKKLAEAGINALGKIPIGHNTKPEDIPICLSSVLRYILMKNGRIPSAQKESQQGIILDSELLKYIENAPQENKEKLFETLSKSKIVYLEDFENSYNFLNRGAGVKFFTQNIFYDLQSGKPLDEILNGNILERAKKLGLEVTVIKNEPPQNITPKKIADNINPAIPSKEEFSKIIDSILNKTFEPNEDAKYKKYVLDFIRKMVYPISAYDYTYYLKLVSKQIDIFLAETGRNPENVYYVLPTPEKSFITTIYQYTKANKIDKPKLIMPEYDNWFDKDYNLQNLPKDSTLVILDDCILTGLTMAKEALDYSKKARKLNNISVIFASVVGTKQGIENIKNLIKIHGRDKKDFVITGKVVPHWESNSAILDKRYMNLEHVFPYLTAVTLPYMGPDTNCELIHPLLKKFLFTPKAQKPSNKNLDFTMNF